MKNQTHIFSAYELGATLYMPITHPKVSGILSGETPPPARSLVLCLEDALAEKDVEYGVAFLKENLATMQSDRRYKIFVRPRNLDMASRLSDFDDIGKLSGFVAPKIRVENAADWLDIADKAAFRIMPTMETAEFFDPGRLSALRDILSSSPESIAAIRIGGNDLLGSLGLRRQKNITSWDGALSWVLSMAASMFGSAGLPVAAPVYDIIEDLHTLDKETKLDVSAGFISKTAIHPAQIPIIEAAFQVTSDDLTQAKAILEKNASAVFQIGGVMCEPATHHAWASRILSRANIFGVKDVNTSLAGLDCGAQERQIRV